jgi:PAS domain S-box-containing protein
MSIDSPKPPSIPCAPPVNQAPRSPSAGHGAEAHRLAEQEARNRAILESAVDAIITIDSHGIVESINPATEKLFGYAESELLGANVSILMPAPFAAEHDSYIANYLRTGTQKVIGIGREAVARRKDGTTFPVDLAVGEINYGGRHGFTGIVRDVSDRKAAEESLRNAREFAEGIIDSAQSIILVLDCDGHIVRFNRFMEDLSGFRLAEVAGKNWFDTFLRPEDRPRIGAIFSDALNQVTIKGNTNAIVCRDRSERQISWWATAMHGPDGAVTGVLSVGHDLTELLEANRKLVQSERLAMLGEAAARLAHESRNSLQRIQLAVGNARLAARDNPLLLKQLASIEQSSEEIGALLTEVRDYASPLSLDKLPTNVAELWQKAWQSSIERRQGRVAFLHEACSAGSRCNVDRFRLAQVFHNLLENSFAACPDPVEIEITAQQHDSEGGPFLEIRFRDHGPGLDPEQRRHVFEPFYTTKSKGTGLGMAIARRIVEAHGGQMTVGEPADGGAEFVIQLPLADG